jgi:hypothetical protein
MPFDQLKRRESFTLLGGAAKRPCGTRVRACARGTIKQGTF